MDAVLTPQITIDDILAALRRVPPQRLADIFQYIEFIEYQAAQAAADASEDEALWAAVEANDAYKQQHLNEEPERYKTGADFLKAVADL
jgi:DNA-binding GntR family transcriptional regulator